MDNDSAFSKVVIGLLFICLIVSGLKSRSLQREVDELEYRIEEIQYQTDDDSDLDYGAVAFCKDCEAQFPEGFAFLVDGEPVCPFCVYDEFKYALSSESGKCTECGFFYERKWGAGYGLCENCGDDRLSECEYCWEYDYVATIGESAICFKCLKNIFIDMELEPYLVEWCNQ